MRRFLIDSKGKLFDTVALDAAGSRKAMDNKPMLADFAQTLFTRLPRFPRQPVKSGDVLYDYGSDIGGWSGLGSGTMTTRVTATVRGTTTDSGRLVLVVDYTGDGRCVCEGMTFSHHGAQLIDLATGLLLAATGDERRETEEGFIRWTYGMQATIQ